MPDHDADAPQLHLGPGGQSVGPASDIHIAAHRGHRRDAAQRPQHLERPDVPRMDDVVDALELFATCGIEVAVGVGDDTDDQAAGWLGVRRAPRPRAAATRESSSGRGHRRTVRRPGRCRAADGPCSWAKRARSSLSRWVNNSAGSNLNRCGGAAGGLGEGRGHTPWQRSATPPMRSTCPAIVGQQKDPGHRRDRGELVLGEQPPNSGGSTGQRETVLLAPPLQPATPPVRQARSLRRWGRPSRTARRTCSPRRAASP